jgi:hypothetical protein
MLKLDTVPSNGMTMRVHGIDNEKPGIAKMELRVNGKSLYSGKVPWGKMQWSDQEFVIPAGVLQKGHNDILFLNITQGTEREDKAVSKWKYFCGWYAIDRIDFIIK